MMPLNFLLPPRPTNTTFHQQLYHATFTQSRNCHHDSTSFHSDNLNLLWLFKYVLKTHLYKKEKMKKNVMILHSRTFSDSIKISTWGELKQIGKIVSLRQNRISISHLSSHFLLPLGVYQLDSIRKEFIRIPNGRFQY